MFGTKMKYALVFLMVFGMLGLSGCILSPTEEPPEKPPTVWKDLTSKEDVITNLLQSYKVHDITHYEELLHTNYLWYNQLADVQGGQEEYYTRDEEIRRTRNMFLAADQRHPDPNKYLERLELTLTTGAWQQIYEYNGTPCDNCWETTREYTIHAVLAKDGTDYSGDDLVKFVIVGVPKSGKTYYYLGRADDINKP